MYFGPTKEVIPYMKSISLHCPPNMSVSGNPQNKAAIYISDFIIDVFSTTPSTSVKESADETGMKLFG